MVFHKDKGIRMSSLVKALEVIFVWPMMFSVCVVAHVCMLGRLLVVFTFGWGLFVAAPINAFFHYVLKFNHQVVPFWVCLIAGIVCGSIAYIQTLTEGEVGTSQLREGEGLSGTLTGVGTDSK